MENKYCNCSNKLKFRSDKEKKSLISRINRINGQLTGIKKMIEENRYCNDVLIQLAATEKAVRSLSTIVLEEHMRTCLIEDVINGNTDVLEEVISLFRRFQ